MKKMNRKGFTLIELLAVIVVLAVIMLLAVNAVIPQMTKARKNAFITEAQTYINAAGTWYQTQILEGNTGDNCVSLTELTGQYIEKDSSDYTGSVKVDVDADTNVATYTIWLSNGEYLLSGKTNTELGGDNATTLISEATEAGASTTCGS